MSVPPEDEPEEAAERAEPMPSIAVPYTATTVVPHTDAAAVSNDGLIAGTAADSTVVPEADDAGEALPVAEFTRKTLWYSIANLGYGMFFALNNYVLTLYLQHLGAGGVLIGLMGSSHSVEGAVIQPLVGTASDRLRTRWGRRRPFMLIFAPISALFLLLAPFASHLPGQPHILGMSLYLAVVVLCVFLFTVAFNVAQDPYMALMPDIIPKAQRGRATGIWTFLGVAGQALLLLTPLHAYQKFGLCAVVMLVTTLLTCWKVREPNLPPEQQKIGPYAQVAIALHGLQTLRQARKSLLTLFFSGLGIGAVLPFLTVFVVAITKCSDQQAQSMALVLMVATAIGVLPFGWLCDRIGPKRVLMLGLGLIVIAAVNGRWVHTLPQISVILAIAGLGNAAQSASAYPLLTRIVPHSEVGFYTGLQSTALSIAAPATSVLTGLLVDRGGYRWIFAVCAVSVAIAMFVLSLVKVEEAAQEVRVREENQKWQNAP